MMQCDEINLMLGAFEDNELEPHEMQAVAFHLARCTTCTAALAEISALGRELRSVVALPALDGFAAAVLARIEHLPTPFTARIARAFARFSEQVSAGFAIATAAAVAAALTVVLASPYAHEMLARYRGVSQPATPVAPLAKVDKSEVPPTTPPALESQESSNDVDMAAVTSDSHAEISRLESESPSVAMWSEPRTKTTVIWLPDSQR